MSKKEQSQLSHQIDAINHREQTLSTIEKARKKHAKIDGQWYRVSNTLAVFVKDGDNVNERLAKYKK